ncbi:TRAP transporter substrate-binding protein [Thermodesulfobacteriota bacterium]
MKKDNRIYLAPIFIMVLLFTFMFSGMAIAADKPINLRYASYVGPTHQITKADMVYKDYIEKMTKGKVKITMYTGATLIPWRESYDGVVKGTADFAYANAEYAKAYDFTIGRNINVFFYSVTDNNTARIIYNLLRAKFPEIDEEYKATKCAVAFGNPPYHVLNKTKPIRTIDDFKGQQLKVLKRVIPLMKTLGAVPVPTPMGEAYVSMQKNIIHGLLAPWETFKSFRFHEVVKSTTDLGIGQGMTRYRHFNWKVWNSLPPAVQQVFEESFGLWEDLLDKSANMATTAGIDLAKKAGVEFIKLSESDQAKFYKLLEDDARKMAKTIDKKGKPGTAILEETLRLAKKYGK